MAKKQSAPVTQSNAVVAPITFDDLAETMQRFKSKRKLPKELKVAPDVYEYINTHFVQDKKFKVGTIYGITVELDETLPHGAWKVVEK